jgi:hypothetical protein
LYLPAVGMSVKGIEIKKTVLVFLPSPFLFFIFLLACFEIYFHNNVFIFCSNVSIGYAQAITINFQFSLFIITLPGVHDIPNKLLHSSAVASIFAENLSLL